MTPDEIEKLAIERYPIKKGACRREREDMYRLRKRFIERMSLQIKENAPLEKGWGHFG